MENGSGKLNSAVPSSNWEKWEVLWFLVELSCKTPWHHMQANHEFWRNTKRSWQFWCWYKQQGLRWEGLVICKSAPSWQKSNYRIKAFKQKWGCRLGKEAGIWELVLLVLKVGRYCSADHFFLSLAGKKRLTKEYHSPVELWLLYTTSIFNCWEGAQKKKHKTFLESGLCAEIWCYLKW